MNVSKPAKSGRKLLFVEVLAAIAATVCFGFFLGMFLDNVFDITAARNEIDALLEIVESHEAVLSSSEPNMAHSELSVPHVSAFDVEMREINPDYACWISIDNTVINYPVVRGDDNDKYLELSFYGEINGLGTLFMDYRCEGDYVPHIIIYGHNSRHGDMFGSLRNFLDERFLVENPIIALKANDQVFKYEIFSARKTNVNDPAYFIDFNAPGSFEAFAERCGAPPGAEQIITLSTCVSGVDKDERVVVQGVLLRVG